MEKKWDYSIDLIRSIAIVIVVFGHSIILYSSAWNIYTTDNTVIFFDKLKNIINVIQMPLFFALSGALVNIKGSVFSFVKKKARRLLIPFIIFGLFWLLPIRLLIGYPGYKGLNIIYIIFNRILLGFDNGHLWFLPTLYFCFILFFCISKVLSRYPLDKTLSGLINIAFGGALFILGIHLCFPSYLYHLSSNYIWFSFGYFLRCVRTRIQVLPYRFFLIPLCIISIFIIIHNTNIYLNALLGFPWVGMMFACIPNQPSKFSEVISTNSYGIYLFHSPFAYFTYTYWPFLNPLLVMTINFFIFGGLSYIMTMIIRSSRFRFIVGE